MRNLFAAFVVVLSACGAADFSGKYSGPFNVNGTCADGRTLVHGYDAGWEVTQKGDRLSIQTNGSCAVWTATVLGDSARVDPLDCGQTGGGGVIFWPSLTEATITLKEEGLSVVGGFHDESTTPELDGGKTTCTTVLSAELGRQ